MHYLEEPGAGPERAFLLGKLLRKDRDRSSPAETPRPQTQRLQNWQVFGLLLGPLEHQKDPSARETRGSESGSRGLTPHGGSTATSVMTARWGASGHLPAKSWAHPPSSQGSGSVAAGTQAPTVPPKLHKSHNRGGDSCHLLSVCDHPGTQHHVAPSPTRSK